MRRLLLVIGVLAVVGGGVWLLTSDDERPRGAAQERQTAPLPERSGAVAALPQREAASAVTPVRESAPPPLESVESAAEAAPDREREEREPDHPATDADVPDDRPLYAQWPLSRVPHEVLKGWGAGPDARTAGVVGVYVVVDPGLPTRELKALARDIRTYHGDKDVVNARIVDSEEAVEVDRHEDGGAALQHHLVAEVRYDRHLEVDSIRVRGEEIPQ